MKFRTILLGTAAAFAVTGAAHAADLAVAESVDYVKVCDAYGAGYWYVPGSDVCLHIGGYVLFDTYFHNGKYLNFPENAGDIPGVGTGGPSGYHASWHFYEENELDVDAKWMTDLGAATIHMALRNNNDPSSFSGSAGYGGSGTVNGNGRDGGFGYVDTVYFKIGGLKAGYDASTFDGGKFYGLYGWESPFDHDRHQNQIQWSTTAGGWGFFLAAEDPRHNTGGSAYYAGNWPDIVAAISGGSGPISWRWSAAATDTNYGTGWGTEFDIRWQGAHGIEGGTGISLQAAVGNDAGSGYAINIAPNGGGGTPWHVTGQGGIAWTSAFTTLPGVSYRALNSGSELEVSLEGDVAVTKGFEAGIAASWDDPSSGGSTTTVALRGKASF